MSWKSLLVFAFLTELFQISVSFQIKVSHQRGPDDNEIQPVLQSPVEKRGNVSILALTPPALSDYHAKNGQVYQPDGTDCFNGIRYTYVYPRKYCTSSADLPPYQYEPTPSYQVCFDHELGVTHFAYNYIYGETLKNAKDQGYPTVPSSTKYDWDNAEPMFEYDYDEKYANMKDTLKNLLVDKKFANAIPFNKGHLIPRGDFSYWEAFQASTFFYFNAAPQLKNLNAGNWNTIEEQVRRLAVEKGITLHVWTGTHGVLEVFNSNGKPTKVYLGADGRMPVPKYIWKLIYNEDKNFAVAFIQLNHPTEDATKAYQLMPAACRDRTTCGTFNTRTQYGLTSSQSRNAKQGYTGCCSFADFKQVIPYSENFQIPEDAQMYNV